jgi:hypothetical protein
LNDSNNERSPLIKNHVNGISPPSYYNEAVRSDRHSVCIVESDTDEPVLESLYCQNFSHGDHHHHRHHHQTSPSDNQSEQLMQIGIQTALAISIHKFPGMVYNLIIVTQTYTFQ